MRLDRLAERIGARLVVSSKGQGASIGRVYAGDRMSDLLSAVSDDVLLVTNLSNNGLARLIELMDVPGLCLLNGAEPDAKLFAAAKAGGAALLVSPAGMYETCGRLYRALHDGGGLEA